MADYDAFDDRFWSLVIGSAAIERLWSGGRWVEGPVYVPAAKAVVWSDIPEDRLMRYDETPSTAAEVAVAAEGAAAGVMASSSCTSGFLSVHSSSR